MQRILLFGTLIALLSGVFTYHSAQQQQMAHAQERSKAVLQQVYLRGLREYYQYLYDVRHHQQQGLLTQQTPTGAVTPYLSNHVAVVNVDHWLATQATSVSPYSIIQLNLTNLQGSFWPERTLSPEVRLLITLDDGEGYQQLWALNDWLQRLFLDTGITEPAFHIESVHSQSATQAFQQPIVFPDFLLPQLQLVVEQRDLIAQYYQATLPWLWASSVTLILLLTMVVSLWAYAAYTKRRSAQPEPLVEACTPAVSDLPELSSSASLTRQERLASLGEMTSGILHEINNPLAYVQSNLMELKGDFSALVAFISHLDQASDSLDIHSEFYQQVLAHYQSLDIQHVVSEAPQRLADCELGVQRMQSIIEDMRRIGRQTANKAWHPLNNSIRSAINIARNKLPSNVTLTESLIDIPDIYCNASQISQVVINLLVNAMQALEDGGHIQLEQRINSEWLCLSIRDDGPGIDEAIVAKIFDPFFTTKSEQEGSGLGLSICQKIIQQHGGRIELTTSLGNGACFDVYLPLSVADEFQEVEDAQ